MVTGYGTVFLFGANDTAIENGQLRCREGDLCDTVVGLVVEAKRLGDVLFTGPPPVSDAHHNERINWLSVPFQCRFAPLGIAYLDIFSQLIKDAIWIEWVRTGDGSHPGTMGYEWFAAHILDWSAWWFPPSEPVGV